MVVTPFDEPQLKKHMLHTNFTALSSTELELLLTEVLHCRTRELLLWLCSWQITIVYKLDVCPLKLYCRQNMNFLGQDFQESFILRITERHRGSYVCLYHCARETITVYHTALRVLTSHLNLRCCVRVLGI